MANALLDMLGWRPLYLADEQRRLFGGRLDDGSGTQEATAQVAVPPRKRGAMPEGAIQAGRKATAPLRLAQDVAQGAVQGAANPSQPSLPAMELRGDATLPGALATQMGHSMEFESAGRPVGRALWDKEGRIMSAGPTAEDWSKAMLGNAAGGAPGLSLEQIMGKLGTAPYAPLITNVPDPFTVFNTQRGDEARKMAAALYGQQLEGQSRERAAKIQAEAHLAAQKAEHLPRFIDALLAAGHQSGQGTDPEELRRLVNQRQELLKEMGMGGNAPASTPGASPQPLPDGGMSGGPRLTTDDIVRIAAELGGTVGAGPTGSKIVGTSPATRATVDKYLAAMKASQAAQTARPKIWNEITRSGAGGGHPGIEKPLLEALIHRAGEVYGGSNGIGAEGLEIPGAGFRIDREKGVWSPGYIVSGPQGEIGRVPQPWMPLHDFLPTRTGSEAHKRYKQDLDLLIPEVLELERRKRTPATPGKSVTPLGKLNQ